MSEVSDRGTAALTTYRFDFIGRTGEYFRIWVVSLFLSVVTLGIYSAWGKVRKKRYLYSHTEARRHRIRVPRHAARYPQGTRDRARSARRVRAQRPRVADHAARIHHHPAGANAVDRGRGVAVQRSQFGLAQHHFQLRRRLLGGGEGLSRARRAGGGDPGAGVPVRPDASRTLHHRASPLRRHANPRRPHDGRFYSWPISSRR